MLETSFEQLRFCDRRRICCVHRFLDNPRHEAAVRLPSPSSSAWGLRDMAERAVSRLLTRLGRRDLGLHLTIPSQVAPVPQSTLPQGTPRSRGWLSPEAQRRTRLPPSMKLSRALDLAQRLALAASSSGPPSRACEASASVPARAPFLFPPGCPSEFG